MFTLAVCAEMVFRTLPVEARVKKIAALGFQVEIWDWTKHDIAALSKSEQRRIHSLDRTAVVNEAFELDDLRHQIQIDRNAVRADNRLNFQGDAGVARFEIRRS